MQAAAIASREPSRRQWALLAVFPTVALGLANHLWTRSLFDRHPLLFWAADVTQFVLVPLAVCALLWRLGGVHPREYGYRPFPDALDRNARIAGCLFVAVVFWLAYRPVREIAVDLYPPNPSWWSYGEAIPEPEAGRVLVVAYFASSAAVLEETVYRGLLWRYFSSLASGPSCIVAYVVTSAFLFSVVHVEQGPHGMLPAFTLGMTTAILYARLQTLWPFLGGHLLLDLAGFW